MYDGLQSPGRNDECWCGSGKKYKKCHLDFDERLEELAEAGEEVPPRDLLKPRPRSRASSAAPR